MRQRRQAEIGSASTADRQPAKPLVPAKSLHIH